MTDNIDAGAPEGIYGTQPQLSRRRRAPEDPIAVAIELERQKAENTPSKRLHIAALAMQALVQAGGTDIYRIAHQAVAMADALIEVEGN